ncbi:MAG: ATP-binding protein [Desulfobacteraceae bacterium]
MALKNKVGFKLIGVNLLSLLLALIGLLLIMRFLATRQILEWHQQRVGLVARLVLAEYQEKNQKVVQAADLLANTPSYADLLFLDDFESLRYLATPQMKEAGLHILTITDRRGVIVVRAHAPGAIGVDISGNPLVRSALKGKRASRITQWQDSIALSAAAPIFYGKEVMGVVLTGLLIDRGFVESISRGPGAEAAIFYANRVIVNSFKDVPEAALQELKLGKDRAATAAQASARVQSIVLGDRTYTITYLPLEQEEKPWEDLIVVGISHKEVANARDALNLVIFGVGGGSALLGIFLSFLLSLGMRRQIAHLAEGTRKAAREELAGDIPVTSRDELGDLAKSFNNMTRSLREKTQLLQEERDRIAANADFLSMIVHDIKAPLTGVRLTIEALQDETLPPEVKRKLQGILKSSEGLLLHVHNVLDVSRFESGHLDLQPESLVPGMIINRIVQHYAGIAQHQGVNLQAELPSGLPPIWADEHYLERVLFNLIANALEATPAGGQIRVLAQSQTLDGALPAVEIIVGDTGAGMVPETLETLFQKYPDRANHDARYRAAGSGLGLYICKTIVEAHQGKIWAESAPGQGTRIHVCLPTGEGNAGAGS